jgi:ABC-type polysaccharide/polyol phosphate transport system ATPase subunit
MSSEAVVFDRVVKSYDLSGGIFAFKDFIERCKNGNLRSHKKSEKEDFRALDDVSFVIKHGERVGIIGANGAGKSTTLKMMNRVIYPNSGSVRVNGSTGGLIELGAGFNGELSGRDNIFLNSAIYGWTKKQTKDSIDQIAGLAELTDFLDVPVKKYSSGMRVRLAFAVAVAHSPDIVLLDEVLAVGDIRFRQRCLQIITEFVDGKTVIFVSHSFEEIRQICDRVLVFNHGRVAFDGDVDEGEQFYLELMGQGQKRLGVTSVPVNLRRGQGEEAPLKIRELQCYDDSIGTSAVVKKGSDVRVEVSVYSSNNLRAGEECRLHVSVKQQLLGKLTEVISGTVVDFMWLGLNEQTHRLSFNTECLHASSYVLDAWVETLNQNVLSTRQIHSIAFNVESATSERIGLVDLGFRSSEMNHSLQ